MADIWSPPSKGSAGVLMMHAGLLPWLNGTCGGTKPPVLSQVKKISVKNAFWFKSLINSQHDPSCFCPALDELIYKEKKERWGFFSFTLHVVKGSTKTWWCLARHDLITHIQCQYVDNQERHGKYEIIFETDVLDKTIDVMYFLWLVLR